MIHNNRHDISVKWTNSNTDLTLQNTAFHWGPFSIERCWMILLQTPNQMILRLQNWPLNLAASYTVVTMVTVNMLIFFLCWFIANISVIPLPLHIETRVHYLPFGYVWTLVILSSHENVQKWTKCLRNMGVMVRWQGFHVRFVDPKPFK